MHKSSWSKSDDGKSSDVVVLVVPLVEADEALVWLEIDGVPITNATISFALSEAVAVCVTEF